MESCRTPFRIWSALLAVVALSALSAAEATLAAAPLFDAEGDGGWPASVAAVKDRDSVNHRAARAGDGGEQQKSIGFNLDGVGPAAMVDAWSITQRHAAIARLEAASFPVPAVRLVSIHQLALPPPMP